MAITLPDFSAGSRTRVRRFDPGAHTVASSWLWHRKRLVLILAVLIAAGIWQAWTNAGHAAKAIPPLARDCQSMCTGTAVMLAAGVSAGAWAEVSAASPDPVTVNPDRHAATLALLVR